MKKILLVGKIFIGAGFFFALTILFTQPVVIFRDTLAYTEVDIEERKETNLIVGLQNQYQNEDIVATISISDTQIEGIIAQTGNNSYYLNYNLYKRRDYKGSLFIAMQLLLLI